MTSIPQEVVEVILVDFDPVADRNSLKSISLTATNFTGPSQRCLFRTLGLHGPRTPGWCPTFDRALNLLNGSPHIASYVKDLTIRLPLTTAPEQHDPLERLLPKFENVRRFILDGVGISWVDLQPGLQSTLTAFLLGSSFEKLHLIHISDIPLHIITIAAQIVPVISLQNVFIKKHPEMPRAEPNPCLLPRLTHLMVSSPHGIQSHLFQELILPSTTANLQRLAVEQSDTSAELIRALAPTLTELSLNCTATGNSFTLPFLPQLTTLELQVAPNWESILPAWLPATLSSLPDAVPALHTLTVRIALPVLDAHARKQDLALPGTQGTATILAAVDAILCGVVSLCVWELSMAGAKAAAGIPHHLSTRPGTSQRIEAREGNKHCALVFARFRAAVERNVVRMRAESALEVRYAEQLGYVESLP
ncbi:hypothetical protein MVEN_01823600 [Mycena venus]|uniref:Uncharacterized protein n=1 Tax=Mycena venus TaxID=2733690 RepID=A0A8H6XL98_9AGAR|nr:hypothetical protein MVEN_01823600 [Mycena venus]